MSALGERSPGLGHPVVLAAGLSWGLLAASRLSVALATSSGGETGVVWRLAPPWICLVVGVGVWVLQFLVAAWQQGWLARQGLERPRARRLAALAWLPSLALIMVPLAEIAPAYLGISLAPLALAREAWVLAAVAAAGVVVVQTRLAAPEIVRKPGATHRVWLSLVVFLLALVVFAGVGARLSEVSSRVGKFMGGDEPQYLFNAQSLAVDHDLDLAENIFLRESSYFIDPAKVIGGHGGWTKDGRWISKHRPGLPVLMAPFYAWGLYLGEGPRKTATVALWLLGAWMVLEVFWLGRIQTEREGPALFAAAGAALAMPVLIYSNLAFPEIAAAAFGISAFRLLRSAGHRDWGMLLLAGLLTGYLAWFHERFVVMSVLLGLYCLARGHWRSFRGLLAFFLPCLVSAALLISYFYYLYGHPFPSQHIHAQGHYLNPRGLWEGLSGLWVDAGEGLLTYGAIWLAAVAGLFWLLRRSFSDGFWALVMAGSVYLIAGCFADWHGGIGPPSRYLVAAVPFLALGLAAGLRWGPPRFGVFLAVLGLATLAASFWVMRFPSAVYGHKVVLGSGLQFPLIENLLPAFIYHYQVPEVNSDLALVWMWLAAMGVLAMSLGSQVYSPSRALAGLCLAFALVAGAGMLADKIGPGVLTLSNPSQRVVLWNRLSDLPPGGPTLRQGSARINSASLMVLPLPPARYVHGDAKLVKGAPKEVEIAAGVKPQLFVWGQYLALPPGRYRATALITSPYQGPEEAAWLDLSKDKGQRGIKERKLSGADLGRPVSLEFSQFRWATNLEFRVGTTGKAPLKVVSMSITRLEP